MFLSLFISIVNFISAPPGISCSPLLPHPDFSNLHQLCRSPDTLSVSGIYSCGASAANEAVRGSGQPRLERVNASLVQTRAEEMQRRVDRVKGHIFPQQSDLARETGSSWWQPSLGAGVCPRPRLPVSVALEARLFTGPQVILKQIMETNSVCLLSPHGAVALCRWAHGCTWSASSTKPVIDYGGSGPCQMTAFQCCRQGSWRDLPQNRRLWIKVEYSGSVRAVWYWHSMEGSSVKGTEDSSALW